MHLRFLALILALAVALPAAAELELVRDIETTGEPFNTCSHLSGESEEEPAPWFHCRSLLGSLPSQLTALGGRLLFIADDRVHGGEPWVSDGTAAGTELLADLCPGECSSRARILGKVGGDVLFWAEDEEVGGGLWRTDGTSEGTLRVRNLCPPTTPGSEEALCGIPDWNFWWGRGPKAEVARIGGRLFFVFVEGQGSSRLWVSDGTEAGTRPVGPATFRLRALRAVGERVYFIADGEIWKITAPADGSGDVAETIFTLPEVASSLEYLVPLGDALVWMGGPLDGPLSLWRVGGGRPAEELLSLASGSDTLTPIGVAGGALYFVVNPGGDGPYDVSSSSRVWRTDGTRQGTAEVWTADGLRDFLSNYGNAFHAAWDRHAAPWRGGFLVRGGGSDQQGVGGRSGLWFVDLAGQRFEFLDQTLGIVGRPEIEEIVHGRLLFTTFFQTTRGPFANHYLLGLSDGSPAGTGKLVETVEPFSHDYDVLGTPEVELVGDTLFVSLDTLTEGRELYRLSVRDLFGKTTFLQDGRYRVAVRFLDHRNGEAAEWAPALSEPSRETARFWFFRPENPEVVVKVLDGRAVNGNVWVFHGGTTDLAYEVEVRDVETWERRTFTRPAGTLCGDFDTGAFVAGTAGASASPAASTEHPAATAGCGDGVLCLGPDGRFRVRVRFRNQYAGGAEGDGLPVKDSDRAGWFWFFNPDKLELMVKVLDGRPVNGHHWVLWGGLTTVEYDLEVTDTATDTVRTYHHPGGDLCGGADTAAF